MAEKTPKRPSNLSIYGETCLRALAKAGLGDKISLGDALGLLHYLDYRPTHDVDAWWSATATEEERQQVMKTVQEILRSSGESRFAPGGMWLVIENRIEG